MTDGATIRRAEQIAGAFAARPNVVAVALAGSRVAAPALGLAIEPGADLDLYVYSGTPLSVAARASIAASFADDRDRIELDNRFWEPGDEWRDAECGLRVDVTYRTPVWIEEQLARLLDRHEAADGYTTCFWHNVRFSRPLFDRDGWFARLLARVDRPYPEELRRSIVAKNLPVLRRIHSSYLNQLEAAFRRDDPVAVSHRLAALLASYFDVLFTLNRQLHPGEKRLPTYADALCPARPPDLAARVSDLLASSLATGDAERALTVANGLIDDLEALLVEDGLLPAAGSSRPPAGS